ncbi:hypothetical protein [Fluviicola sp.]|jgi:hypothetical protein|uniref:hypothetical protein n=1 Tax=Fluviicola sp. TaxID=1917219 RepID=UPI00282324A6|nr:hypothetical protein [Fluviicola sp.]MDR0801686.1 hypothetical protein [Fluviicola sp.]
MHLLSSLIFLFVSCCLFGQSGSWVQNSEYFKNKLPYQVGSYLFEDGSFQLSEGNYRFKFDSKGILNKELIQEVIEEKSDSDQKTSSCTTFDMKTNTRYTFVDDRMHIEHFFSDRKNEYRAVAFEKQEHVVKSVWDAYSNNANYTDAGIITSIRDKVILYQTYYAISANTHPGQFKPKGINTYLRLSILNLKDYTVTYEYLLIDVFDPSYGKKKEMLDFYDFKCIGINKKQELLFCLSKTVFKDRHAPPLTISDYKSVDYCKSNLDVWAVNLDDFSQKKVYSTVVESNQEATSVSFNLVNDGWMLTWTKLTGSNAYSFQACVFELDANYYVKETPLNFPSSQVKLSKPQTPNLKIYKDLNGQKQFCTMLPNNPAIFILDERSELKVVENTILKWDLLKNYVMTDSDMMCLPCMKPLTEEETKALSALPEMIAANSPHTRILRFRKVNNEVFYLHMETLNQVVETGHVEKIKELYLRTGKISL